LEENDMNLSVLKTLGFWAAAIPVIAGLLISSGLVLDGSTVDQVIGWILALGGVIGGQKLAAPAPVEPPAA
jgi:hypothetical protein